MVRHGETNKCDPCGQFSNETLSHIFIICAYNIYVVNFPHCADHCVHIKYHTVNYCKAKSDTVGTVLRL